MAVHTTESDVHKGFWGLSHRWTQPEGRNQACLLLDFTSITYDILGWKNPKPEGGLHAPDGDLRQDHCGATSLKHSLTCEEPEPFMLLVAIFSH